MAKKNFAQRYARFMLRHRWPVIILCFAFTLFAALFVNQVNLRNDPDSLLPLSNRYIATNLYSELTYGMGNLMVWGMKVKEGDIYQPWFVRMVDELYDDVTELEYANPANFIGLASSKMRHLGLSEDQELTAGHEIYMTADKDVDHYLDRKLDPWKRLICPECQEGVVKYWVPGVRRSRRPTSRSS